MSGSVATALRRGQEFLKSGEKTQARAWLDRAHRLAPEDASVRLLLASALAGADEGRCRELLTSLVTQYPDFREARIALSACALRGGAVAAAAAELDTLLRRCAPPDNTSFRQLADRVTAEVQAAGWIGMDARGQVQVFIVAGSQTSAGAARFNLWLDRKGVWSETVDVGRSVRMAKRLSGGWCKASILTAELDGRPLLGSGVHLAQRRSVQGFVEVGPDGLVSGWAWHPADPEAVAVLDVTVCGGGRRRKLQIRADDETLQSASEDGPVRARGFRLRIQPGAAGQVVSITGSAGDALLGSPVHPFAECFAARAAAALLGKASPTGARRPRCPSAGSKGGASVDMWRPLPAFDVLPRAARAVPPRRAVDVVIPVYRGVADFVACLASLRRRWPGWARLVVVDDGSPDKALQAELAARSAAGQFVLLRHDQNLGFPAAVNTGLRHSYARSRDGQGPRDIVLLNPDTLLPPGWLERLLSVAYSRGDIGSATPLTNRGTIMAYPLPNFDNNLLDLPETDRLDKLMRLANPRGREEVPTAVGFCMLIRHDCLAEVGLFREGVFAQGYGEENDWCLRARQLGWTHVAATGVFVAHHGGTSFGAGRRHLLARNGRILERLHPGYDAMIAAFAARDPLHPHRFRADVRRWVACRGAQPTGGVLLITHEAGGGVQRFVAERCASVRAAGRRALLLRPILAYSQPAKAGPSGLKVSDARLSVAPSGAESYGCRISDGFDDDVPNLRFDLPAQRDLLIQFLRSEQLEEIEVHHLLGHAPNIIAALSPLGLPYRVFIHDYVYWCPRITLCTIGPRYCGEPVDARICDACVADVGRRAGPDVPVDEMRVHSSRLLAAAREVVVSCEDVAIRMMRHFPDVATRIATWEDDTELAEAYRRASAGRVPQSHSAQVLVVGAIGADKGYDVLLGCVRDAGRRKLDLNFVLIGYSMDDERLIDAGSIFISGAFEEHEAVALVAAQQAHVGFIPSIWPETWCYSLSTMWRAGLRAAAFGLGAPAERIRRTGLGAVLPVGLTAERINDALLKLAAHKP